MTVRNLLTAWSELVVDTLVHAGITDLVVSPGSRSTSFVLAAARHAGLRCHDVIDERAAAFFALGQARVTGRPSALLCTSGTAAAQYFPAVVEASVDHVPLVVLTGDRPLELVDCGAPQTIDQVKLFGGYVRKFLDLGAPEADLRALRGARRMVAQAVFAATWPTPGPVHLNLRARKPFEPVEAETPEERKLAAMVSELCASAPVPRAPIAVPHPDALDQVARLCAEARRGVLICGPGPLAQKALRGVVHDVAARTGFPLLAEGASQLRFTAAPDGVAVCDAFDLALKSAELWDEGPDLVVQIGASPTSGVLHEWLNRHRHRRVVLAEHGWRDWLGTADLLVFGEPGQALRGLHDRLEGAVGDDRLAWQDRLLQANRRAWGAVEQALGGAWTEGVVAREVVASLPEGGLLMVGNSLAIRLLDLYVPAQAARIGVLSQRGANGIDGLIAGSAGSASIAGPLTLLLGDVSALHDLSSLQLTQGAPVTVVVLQNGGGRIFEQLPVARAGLDDAVLAHLTTPHHLDFAHAAAQFGHRYLKVSDRAELAEALATSGEGPTLVEAVVPPHGAAQLLASLRRRLAAPGA